MRFLNLTLPTPEENLALDEALLLEAEHNHSGETLRFWESPEPFVVVGVGARVQQEVYLDVCQAGAIPVLRRCSGGGTVVQGPGCLNYALILTIPDEGPLATIQGTNRMIMRRNANVIARLVQQEVSVQGHTDLVMDGHKISGNAQRRLRRHLLFHGTFLLGLDCSLITQLLPEPATQPAYRQQRSHAGFARNLELNTGTVMKEMQHEWNADEPLKELPTERLDGLLRERYRQPAWNLRIG